MVVTTSTNGTLAMIALWGGSCRSLGVISALFDRVPIPCQPTDRPELCRIPKRARRSHVGPSGSVFYRAYATTQGLGALVLA